MRKISLGFLTSALLVGGLFCGVLMYAFSYRDADTVHYAGRDYLASGTSDTGAANLVSAIYLNYRLFDTLFEILVFSVAVLGVRFYLVGREEEESVDSIPESGIVRTSADLLFPLILLIGIYLTLLGHLSPGGGFSGGVVAGSGLLLCAVAVGADVVGQRFHETLLERLEWGVLLVILLVGLLPLLFHRLPLVDLLPRGKVGRLISGGAIPLYNILIGGKVFIGTWVIIHYFLRHRGEI